MGGTGCRCSSHWPSTPSSTTRSASGSPRRSASVLAPVCARRDHCRPGDPAHPNRQEAGGSGQAHPAGRRRRRGRRSTVDRRPVPAGNLCPRRSHHVLRTHRCMADDQGRRPTWPWRPVRHAERLAAVYQCPAGRPMSRTSRAPSVYLTAVGCSPTRFHSPTHPFWRYVRGYRHPPAGRSRPPIRATVYVGRWPDIPAGDFPDVPSGTFSPTTATLVSGADRSGAHRRAVPQGRRPRPRRPDRAHREDASRRSTSPTPTPITTWASDRSWSGSRRRSASRCPTWSRP